ncbi:indole-3-acetic acid-amido synthetase GH3.6-like [Solanum tuberosum]|uniref:Indole-3-acetic acid-amido synthetase GH3.6 n=1 Tax=Solanum tuberosum TaxID=4113 RepID=M1CC70_SOLTU|nr:PREDICTED: indole-3-acetic acid-amido synthetase GH3.6-like [Solanum tuberosum]XP_006362918.1 PREDICTED: indole-3-acetic acid-amido synthetase GH3.6-like [Solanum tuberosum]XP_006362919.1 PREDICTED: indole-3-acetic acid-amido synthetase GH3.6-like [Solanum tuberosum]XP_015158711.1 PREDICTED: indole-3-acetic acid-amido synthetase GH3.6-like [Solanum tuberosum]XP_015158712.1 PREDICTED: indole-3-acetic acid-amido synthetase GH3.6-like [Solanum tuberosum]XP_015158713.1 PREDICTED: indole-3-aceti
MEGSMTEENKKNLEFIEEVTSNVDEVQKRVLHEILTRNANVEYLQRLNLNGHTDRETFKKVVPIITYEDIQSDINRIANGDRSPILCSQPISEFFTSSGTSGGERKLIPTTEEENRRRHQLYGLMMSVVSQFFPDLGNGKGMYFMFIKSEAKTPGGLLARPILTSVYKSSLFKNSNSRVSPYTSPIEAILCLDSYQSMYSQMLCGLFQNREVVRVGSIFAYAFIRAMRFLEDHWSLLCNDIRTGTINNKITDPSVREAVMKILKPDSELADFIEAECSKDSWEGIVTRLWPNTTYVDVVVTGAMSQYIPMLDYYCNSLPLVSTAYASSECFFGINLNPLCKPSEVSYTLIPIVAYFEFLPIHRSNEVIDSISIPTPFNEKDEQQLVDLVDVKIGQEYELVVTTYSGLYRYRVGDVLRVAGYKNNAPQFNFIRRENVILSIDSDKTNEIELQNAVKNAENNLMPFDASVIDYTSYVDTATIPGHYVLFWELNVNASSPIPPSVLEECCLTIEESLNSVYRQGRTSDKSIGPLEIRIVETGTFDKLMDYCCTSLLGASINQYKTPRCVKFAPHVELLNSRVVSSYFSPVCPKWVPGSKQWNNTN